MVPYDHERDDVQHDMIQTGSSTVIVGRAVDTLHVVTIRSNDGLMLPVRRQPSSVPEFPVHHMVEG